MKRKRGFTLIELLVVVAIIALLIAILLPALGRVKETTRRTTCAANLKAQGQSVAIYASQYLDSLPLFNDNGLGLGWLWDESQAFGDNILNIAASNNAGLSKQSVRKLFYCPSNTNQNADALWNWPNQNATPPFYGYSLVNPPPPCMCSAMVT